MLSRCGQVGRRNKTGRFRIGNKLSSLSTPFLPFLPPVSQSNSLTGIRSASLHLFSRRPVALSARVYPLAIVVPTIKRRRIWYPAGWISSRKNLAEISRRKTNRVLTISTKLPSRRADYFQRFLSRRTTYFRKLPPRRWPSRVCIRFRFGLVEFTAISSGDRGMFLCSRSERRFEQEFFIREIVTE